MTIVWRSKMSVGEPVIDNDHKRLISLINDYEKAIEAKSVNLLKNSFDKLLEYTEIHFNREENLMRAIHYSGYKDHKIMHQLLIDNLNRFHHQVVHKGEHISISKANDFMHDWLIDHVLNEDMKIKPLLMGKDLREVDQSWK